MVRVGFPLILTLAAGLAMPGLASSQTMTDQPFVAGESPAIGAQVEQPTTAAEKLRPTASTAALSSPVWTESRSAVAAEPYRQVDIDDGDNDGVPYMIAGGIAFLAGAIVGDDVGTILMLGGAGVGAYGAFLYFGGD